MTGTNCAHPFAVYAGCGNYKCSDCNYYGKVAQPPAPTVTELGALPSESVLRGRDEFGSTIIARKPLPTEYPHAVPHFWEVTGSELGTDSETLIRDYDLEIIYKPSGADRDWIDYHGKAVPS